MSHGKYAHITADLLARKGEARPWPALTAEEMPEHRPWRPLAAPPPPPPSEEMPEHRPWRSVAAPPPPPPPEIKERNCAIRMSAHDYERLGILAVKADVTRQQLLKQALEEFLASRAAQYGCACLGACNSNCGTAG
jgi:hypothetical protein